MKIHSARPSRWWAASRYTSTIATRAFLIGTVGATGLFMSLGLALSEEAKPVVAGTPAASSARPPLPSIPAPPDVAAPPADAEKTKSGIFSKVLVKGTGTVHPKAGETVEVNYAGWMTNGQLFDTSQKRGTTAKFPLDLLIKGWQEGLKLMVVGEKRRMWIPANLAYGDTPRRPGGPFGTLVFDVELVGIAAGDSVADPGAKTGGGKSVQKAK